MKTAAGRRPGGAGSQRLGVRIAAGLAALAALSLLWAAEARAGAFTQTGTMNTSRVAPASILLPNGKVLVTGGSDGTENEVPLASAELYDPALGSFSPAGSMTTPRAIFSATLLQNGKVLIAGGYNGPSIVSSAELYDPVAGTFTPTGNLTVARYGHRATLLDNGKVLISGGVTGAGDTGLATAELYDPAAGTFTSTGSMSWARFGHSSTLLADGRVLVAGGLRVIPEQNSETLESAELYNPTTNVFSTTGGMGVPRVGHAAVRLAAGAVFVTSGSVDTGESSDIGYIPAEGFFTTIGPLVPHIVAKTATLLNGNTVLMAGGMELETPRKDAEVFDPADLSYTPVGPLNQARRSHGAVRLQNGKVLVVGGAGAAGALSSAELYDPNAPTPRYRLDVSRQGNGQGTVSSQPEGIDCGNVCAWEFNLGAQVTLEATPSGNSSFVSWSGACTGTGPCQVTMNQAAQVTARFDAPVSPGKVGSVKIKKKATVKPGKRVKLKVTVRNTGGQALNAKVTLKSSNRQVKVPRSVTIRVAPGKSAGKAVLVKAGKKAKGKAKITASAAGKKAVATVTVKRARR